MVFISSSLHIIQRIRNISDGLQIPFFPWLAESDYFPILQKEISLSLKSVAVIPECTKKGHELFYTQVCRTAIKQNDSLVT